MLVAWLLAVVAVEALVELLVASDALYHVRLFFTTWPILNAVTTCGYCASFWVAAGVAWALPGELFHESVWGDIVVRTVVLHRLSNVAHSVFRLLNVRPHRG